MPQEVVTMPRPGSRPLPPSMGAIGKVSCAALATGLVLASCSSAAPAGTAAGSGGGGASPATTHQPGTALAAPRAGLAPGKINHIIVIDIENQSFSALLGSGEAAPDAPYLNQTLRAQGEYVPQYFATGHFSLDNYISQISGQSPTTLTKADCASGGNHDYVNITPGADDPSTSLNPGQVDGQGCVYPAPSAGHHGAPTIADQLDAAYPPNPTTHVAAWRGYEGDMGNIASRDGGTIDPLGGTDCAHPKLGALDNAELATPTDQYATRHNPFVWFHSIIDNAKECSANVVPLGKLGQGGSPDPSGHLARDLSSAASTPRFAFVTPNVCDDGHDLVCTGANAEGGQAGGVSSADLFLKHWMPLILGSPAYKQGDTLVVLTFDENEGNPNLAKSATACCGETSGPNTINPGDATNSLSPGSAPGGGQTGALLFNARYIVAGSTDLTGQYNHYAALRSYEDLLGLTSGGTDGRGHIGFAAAPGLVPFGADVFNK
jgi:hypothetical protein